LAGDRPADQRLELLRRDGAEEPGVADRPVRQIGAARPEAPEELFCVGGLHVVPELDDHAAAYRPRRDRAARPNPNLVAGPRGMAALARSKCHLPRGSNPLDTRAPASYAVGVNGCSPPPRGAPGWAP